MERKASVNLHSLSAAYLTELLSSTILPLPLPCLSAAKLKRGKQGNYIDPME